MRVIYTCLVFNTDNEGVLIHFVSGSLILIIPHTPSSQKDPTKKLNIFSFIFIIVTLNQLDKYHDQNKWVGLDNCGISESTLNFRYL